MKKIFSLIMAVLMLSLLSLSAFATSGDTLNDGLVAHYTFDEYDAANEAYIDSVNSASAAKVAGTVSTVDGIIGKAASFDGSTAFKTDASAYLEKCTEMSALTFSVWVYADAYPAVKADGNKYFFTTADWSTGALHLQFVWGDYPGSCQVGIKGIKSPSGGAYSTASNYRTPQATAGAWTLLTFTYDVASASINSYIDGKLADSAVYATATPITINGITLGSHCDLKNYFVGNLDDLRIYNRVLSENEIEALYVLGSAKTPDTTVAPEVTEVPADTHTDPEVTDAPIEDTPAAPVEDTTAAPVEDTTAAPVEDTTAAPETTEQPASPSTGDNAMIIIVLAAIMSLAGATTALVSRHS